MGLALYQSCLGTLVASLLVILMITNFAGSQTIDDIIQQSFGSRQLLSFSADNSTVKVELDMVFRRQDYEAMKQKDGSVGRRRKKRKALRDTRTRWTNNVVPYYISARFSYSDWSQFQAAVDELNRYTCLNVRPSRTSDTNYVKIIDGGGCASYVGMVGGGQLMILGNGCRIKRIIVHEFGHAVGFHHEQTRPDRDRYVTINLDNIESDMAYNFDKHSTSLLRNYSVPYDYRSVMHYGPTAFGVNGKVTIRTTDPYYQTIIGRAQGLSFNDIKLANLMYNCASSCRTQPCPGDGYVGKDCKCYCPGSPIKECQGDLCSSNPCQNSGTCSVRSGAVTCRCATGWTGSRCTTRQCPSNYCSNGGRCSVVGSNLQCTCVSPWTGSRCQTTQCTEGYCANGGVCFSIDTGVVCKCPSSWSGPRCQTAQCTEGYCANGGVCFSIDTGVVCKCPSSWSGPRCQIAQCAQDYCANGGQCSVVGAGAECTCVGQWSGPRCQNRTVSFYTCEPPCARNSICAPPTSNLAQPPTCKACADDSQTGITCILLKGGGSCTFQDHKSFMTQYCPETCGFCDPSSVDPCNTNPCQNNGVCSVRNNAATCRCATGWTGSRCTTRQCPSSYCSNGGRCRVVGTDLQCTCSSPWSGSRCQTNLCSPNPCQNSGTCSVQNRVVICGCQAEWTGSRCTTRQCTQDYCDNGGQCRVVGAEPECTCVGQWSGPRCQNSPEPFYTCEPPCARNSICAPPTSNLTQPPTCRACVDDPQYANICTNSESQGSCAIQELTPFWTAHCPKTCGFCNPASASAVQCTSSYCANGGQCRVVGSSLQCTCVSPWSGSRCQRRLPRSNCVDQHQDCRAWAGSGYCSAAGHSSYMSVSCRQACGLC